MDKDTYFLYGVWSGLILLFLLGNTLVKFVCFLGLIAYLLAELIYVMLDKLFPEK